MSWIAALHVLISPIFLAPSRPLHVETTAPPVTFTAPGGYPRTALLRNGTTLLATSQGGVHLAACGLFATEDSKTWRATTGPQFPVLPGSQLGNCAPGEAPDGTVMIAVRHHDPKGVVFRIQSIRYDVLGQGWDTPVTIYATNLREHACWEPVFFKSLDGKTLRVAYSLERPADWKPPACEVSTNYPGADLPRQPQEAPTAALCQGHCVGNANCNAWSWRMSDHMCWLKSAKTQGIHNALLMSGVKLCGAGMGSGSEFVASPSSASSSGPNLSSGSRHFYTADFSEDSMPSASAALQQDIVMQDSIDNGRTWGPVHVISRTEGSRDGMPSLIRQKDGCLLCVFEGFGGTQWGHFTVRSVRSCDDGKTWVKQNVYPQPSASTAHAPTVALLQDGRAAVSSFDEPHNLNVQFSEQALTGTSQANWTKPKVEVPGDISWPALLTDSTGQLFVAYGVGGHVNIAGPVSTSASTLLNIVI